MKTERQRDVTSSNIGQAKLSKFFTSRDDEDATERKIKQVVVIKAETSSKYFAGDASDSIDESISDFKPERPKRIAALPANDSKDKKPVKTKKAVRKNSTTAPKKKCMKKQQNLLKYTKEFEEVCAIGGVDVNPEHLQLAIALSRSLSDYQDGGNSNKEVAEDALDPSTSQEFKSEEDMVKNIRKTLDQYGFKVPIGPISLMPKVTTKRKRFNKATANSVLMTRSLEEKKQITSTKVSQILFECQIKDPDEDFDSCTKITDLHSNVLRDIWCKTSPIFTKAMLDFKDMEEFDVFYVKNLITPSDTKVGSLLKDWKTIPGRDPSPERKNAETLDFRENILFPQHLDLLLSSTYSYISEKISLLETKSPKKSHSSSKEAFLNDTPPKTSSDVSPKNTCLNHSQIKTHSTQVHNSSFVKDDVIEICDGSRSCSPDIFDDDNYYEDICDTVSTKCESSKQIHIEIIHSSGEEFPKVALTQSQKSEMVLFQSCNNDNAPPVFLETSDKYVDFVEKDNQVIEASIDLTQIIYTPDDSFKNNRCSEFKHDKSNASLTINNFKKDGVVCLIDETMDLDLTNSGSENDNIGSQNQRNIEQCNTSHDFVDISDVQIENQKSEKVVEISKFNTDKNNVSSFIFRNEAFGKSLVVNKHKRFSFNSIEDSMRFDELLRDFKKTQPNVSIDESAEDPFVEDSIDLTQNDYNPANISRNRNCSQVYESQNGIVHFESYHEDNVEPLDISIGGSSPKEIQNNFSKQNVSNISTSSDSRTNYSKNESQVGVLQFESDHEDIEMLDISKSPHKEIEKMVERNNVNDISMSTIIHKTEYHNETGNFEPFTGNVEQFNTSLIRATSSKIIVRRNINDISSSSPESYKNGIVHFESYYEPLDISCSSEEIEKSVRRNVNEISFSSPERSTNVSKEKDTTNIFEDSTVLDGVKSFSFSLDDHEHVTVEKENIDLTQTSNDSANSHSRDIILNQSEYNKEKYIKEPSLILKSPNFKCDDSELFKNDKSLDKIAKDSTGEISAGNDIFVLSDEEFNYSISTPYRPKSLHHSRNRIKNKTNCNDISSSDDDSSSISDKLNKSSSHLNKSTTNRLSTKSTSLHSIKSTKCRLSAKSSSFHLNDPSDISKCKNDEDCNELGVPYRFSNQFNLYGSSIFDQIPSCNSSLANATNCGQISDTSKRKTINPNKETSLAKDNYSFQSESLPNVYLNKDKQTNNRLTIQSTEIDALLRRNKELVNDSPLVKSPSTKDTPDYNKYVIKTDNVTPAQNYSAMNTPKIHKELSKFGLKPLKRKRGKLLLTYLHLNYKTWDT